MLSVLARIHRKGMFQQFVTGESGPRSSAMPTALPGFARGALGSQGSTTLKTRNVNAGEEKEREHMQSPIFQAFLGAK